MIVEQRYSYEELAHILGISPGAARALASRHAWRRVRHPDGTVRVIVPSDALEGRRPAGASHASPVAHGKDAGAPRGRSGARDVSRAAPSESVRNDHTTAIRNSVVSGSRQAPADPVGDSISGQMTSAPGAVRAQGPWGSTGRDHTAPSDDVTASLQIRVAGLEGQVKALTVRADAERRRADEAVMERNEWRALAQVLAESIPDGLRWWRRTRN